MNRWTYLLLLLTVVTVVAVLLLFPDTSLKELLLPIGVVPFLPLPPKRAGHRPDDPGTIDTRPVAEGTLDHNNEMPLGLATHICSLDRCQRPEHQTATVDERRSS